MKRTKRLFTTTVALLMLVGVPIIQPAASAPTQMDATDDPEVTGELELETDGCRTQREKHRGRVVAKGKTCLRIYTYDSSAETDDERNYGVVWLQSNLNSRRGWCGSKVISDVDLPNNVTAESRAPKRLQLNRRRAYETSLTATAGGAGIGEETTISQDQILFPEKVRTKVLADKNIFRLRWVGREKRKLGFASGAEFSWEQGANPGGISFRLNYQLRRGPC